MVAPTVGVPHRSGTWVLCMLAALTTGCRQCDDALAWGPPTDTYPCNVAQDCPLGQTCMDGVCSLPAAGQGLSDGGVNPQRASGAALGAPCQDTAACAALHPLAQCMPMGPFGGVCGVPGCSVYQPCLQDATQVDPWGLVCVPQDVSGDGGVCIRACMPVQVVDGESAPADECAAGATCQPVGKNMAACLPPLSTGCTADSCDGGGCVPGLRPGGGTCAERCTNLGTLCSNLSGIRTLCVRALGHEAGCAPWHWPGTSLAPRRTHCIMDVECAASVCDGPAAAARLCYQPCEGSCSGIHTCVDLPQDDLTGACWERCLIGSPTACPTANKNCLPGFTDGGVCVYPVGTVQAGGRCSDPLACEAAATCLVGPDGGFCRQTCISPRSRCAPTTHCEAVPFTSWEACMPDG